MNKKSFLLYLDQQDLFNKLPDEAAGKLIKHIFSYVNCENPTTDDLLIDVAFSSIKQSLKRDLDKWEKQLKQRSEAGKKSAEARAIKKQRKATTVKSRSTKSTDSVNVNVSDSDSDSEDQNIDTDNKKKQSRKTSLPNNFSVSERVKKWANDKGHTNLDGHLENFILSCKAKDYKYKDWDSAFMNAIHHNWAKINTDKNTVPQQREF